MKRLMVLMILCSTSSVVAVVFRNATAEKVMVGAFSGSWEAGEPIVIEPGQSRDVSMICMEHRKQVQLCPTAKAFAGNRRATLNLKTGQESDQHGLGFLPEGSGYMIIEK